MKKWDNGEVNEKFHKMFKIQNGKVLITLPGLNRLLLDPKCPDPQRSNLVEYLLKMKHQLEAKKQKVIV